MREMQTLCRPGGDKSSFISSDKGRNTKRIVPFTFGCLQIIIYHLKASHSTPRCGISCLQGRSDLSVLLFQLLPSPPIARAPPRGAGKAFHPALLNSLKYCKENLEFSWFSPHFLPSCCPQLCYLYTDLYKQTNSKETRRVFLEFYQFFLDRAAVGSSCFPHFYTSSKLTLTFLHSPELRKTEEVKALQKK